MDKRSCYYLGPSPFANKEWTGPQTTMECCDNYSLTAEVTYFVVVGCIYIQVNWPVILNRIKLQAVILDDPY